MPYASNPIDRHRIWFEDVGGNGASVVMYGGFLDTVEDLRSSSLASALRGLGHRLILVDHRGLGASDKPHDPAAYGMAIRAADAVAVLDVLGIAKAHFIGLSWGGRLPFGIGQHAPGRVLSLAIVGQQPYEWPDSPLTRAVTEGIVASRTAGAAGIVGALEAFWAVRFPDETRSRWLRNDAAAIEAAWTQAIAEGPVSDSLGAWRLPCLICIGAGDSDFREQAERAADEIPGGRLLVLGEADHYRAHFSSDDELLEAVLANIQRGLTIVP